MGNEWFRLEAEPAKAYEAFLVYCKQGTKRTFEKTAEQTGHSKTTLLAWAKEYQWTWRSDQYDGAALSLRAQAEERRMEKEASVLANIVSDYTVIVATEAKMMKRQIKKLSRDPQYHVPASAFEHLTDGINALVRYMQAQQPSPEKRLEDQNTVLTDILARLVRADTAKKGAPSPNADAGREGLGSES